MKKMLVMIMLLCFSLFLIGCGTTEDDVSDHELEAELNLIDNQELEDYANQEVNEDGALAGEASGSKQLKFFKLADGRKINVDSRLLKLSKKVLRSRLIITPTSTCTSNCNNLDSCYWDNNVCQGTVLLIGTGYGHSSDAQLKSYLVQQQNQNYLSGSHACNVMYSKGCVKIEMYSNGKWEQDSRVNCESTFSERFDLSGIYRASCVGSVDVDAGSPPVGSNTGIINQ
jgi:hypothetical protein